ncbi:50S ribosomal protein L4 [Candidatus Uhrbacteria bacterium CG_4_9_14_3_um_filter_36_7]|uniref:Large ribosomal subunit protein uL4 n=1 Tax=Candidatus Uhrbacteria bacterium CG_4_9_14_3_um_filter_36_7 TaxID=1975033 RepID=A0A2M7XHN5_9BACT|nr:MAG: 50S ribosomal protein L4 [Candidatus Uhrbacteria bacterium CG_4_9_14_3_um_filter_36_7]
MNQVDIYNQNGDVTQQLELSKSVFDVKINPALIHQVIVTQQANARQPIAHTKGRAEVRGGGKKPWKQKGTGRARHGSIRSPLWIGGGVTFGPTNERNFEKKINKVMNRQVLRMILTDKAQHEKIRVMEHFDFSEYKTKSMADFVKKIGLGTKKILVIIDTEKKEVARMVRNIPKMTPISVSSLNNLDLLACDYLLFSKPSLTSLTKVLERK